MTDGSGRADRNLPERKERRRYLHVVEEVLRAVSIGTISGGDRLPNERQLSEMCGVSRGIVREALLALELSGVIEIRPGSGCYLTGMGVFTGAQPVPPGDSSPRELLEARQIIEPSAARLAAQRVSPKDLRRLAALIDDAETTSASMDRTVDGPDHFVRLTLAFHRELAQACGNAILASVTGHLVDAGEHPLWLLVDKNVVRDPAIRSTQISEHRAVLTAVAARHSEAAAEAMAVHLGALSARILGPPQASVHVRRARRGHPT